MGNNHDYIALDWVRGEIGETLNQARQALEAYVSTPEDTSRMRFCLNHIHQVHGTLQMVEFYGAALLAEEMEKLTKAILEHTVPHPAEAQEVLMRAIIQMPGYLEHLQQGNKDLPVVLLPLLNDIRASRGETLLSDTSLFTPDLSPALLKTPVEVQARLQDDKVIASLKKLRQMFQFALAGVIRSNDVANNFDYMQKVLARLHKLCQGSSHGQLWWIAQGVLEGMQQDRIALGSATKALLRDLDHELKRLIDEHDTVLQKPAPADLIKNLLYYVAKLDLDSANVRQIQERYRLDQALIDEEEVDKERARMQGPDRDAISSVVKALNEELARLKDQLDLFVRAEIRENETLSELIPGLEQISNTMAVLGLGVPRKIVLDQINLITSLADTMEPIDDNILMDIAGAFLYVEASLSGLVEDAGRPRKGSGEESFIPAEQLGNAHSAVLRETRNGLEQAKTCIVNFIASQWDHDEIEPVPALLDSLRGSLQIIPLEKASQLLRSCNQYIKDVLLDRSSTPDWRQLDTLADAITSIEYYLERITEGSQDNEMILHVAEESVAELGYPVGQAPVPRTTKKPEAEAPTLQPESSASKQADAELIDDEIIEIFVEEAAEVLETIREYYPQFSTNHEDHRALVELRRAYHTLKGSGRLVGAVALGELAWSIENLLNRLIDHTIEPSDGLVTLVGEVNELLPQLIDAFKRGDSAQNIEGFIAQANTLAGVPKSAGTKSAETFAPEISREVEGEALQTEMIDPELPLIPHEEEISTLENALDDDIDSGIDLASTSVDDEQPEDLIPEEAAEYLEPEKPAKPEVVAAKVENEDSLIDEEILEIFIEEAEEVLATINDYLPKYLADFDHREALTEVRRAFHTLKGSGRMVEAEAIGELAWSIENLLNKIIDGSLFMNQDIADLVPKVVEMLPELVDDFRLQRTSALDIQPFIKQAESLASGEMVKPLNDVIDQGESEAESILDPVLLDIFHSETETHLQTLEEFIRDSEEVDEAPYTDALSRALHTLKGSANTANIVPIAEIAIPVEKFVKEARARNMTANQEVIMMLEQAAKYIRIGVDQLKDTPQSALPGTDMFLQELANLSRRTFVDADEALSADKTTDPQIVQIFLTEGIDILLDAENILNDWSQNPVAGEDLDKLVGELKTLSNGAQMTHLDDISELCELLLECYDCALKTQPVDTRMLAGIKQGHECIINMMDQVAAGLATQPDNALLAVLREHLQEISADTSELDLTAADVELPTIDELELADVEDSDIELSDLGLVDEEEIRVTADESITETDDLAYAEELSALDEELDAELSSYDLIDEEAPAETESVAATPAMSVDTGELLDPELVEIFLEEANDIVDQSSELLHQWINEQDNRELLAELQRDLHTLKGGARLADLADIGDLAHELEYLYEGLSEGRYVAQQALLGLLIACHDRLSVMVDQVASSQPTQPATSLIAQVQDYISGKFDTSGEQVSLPAGTADAEPVTSESLLDPELVEIFLEEANDIIDNTGQLIHQWQGQTDDRGIVQELQRELHTLKGGARMADIREIGNLSHELESLFELIADGQYAANGQIIELCLRCHDRLAIMVDQIASNQSCSDADDLVNEVQHCLQAALASNLGEMPEDETLAVVATPETEAPVESTPLASGNKIDETDSILDDELAELFLEEAHDIIDSTAHLLQDWISDISNVAHVQQLQRELHTLKGGARMADIQSLGDLAHELETLFENIVEHGLTVDQSISDLMLACHDRLADMVEQVARGQAPDSADDLIAQVHAVASGEMPSVETAADEIESITPADELVDTEFETVEPTVEETPALSAEPEMEPAYTPEITSEHEVDEDLLELFLDEARDIQEAMVDALDQWRDSPESLQGVIELQRELHTLKGGSRLADIDAVADIAEALYQVLEFIVDSDGSQTPTAIDLTQQVVSRLHTMLVQLDQQRTISAAPDLLQQLQQFETTLASPVSPSTAPAIAENKTPFPTTALDEDLDSLDPEVLEIFLDEADELLEALENHMADWAKDPTNQSFNRELQRVLHTVKGGARLANLVELGDESHHLEALLIDILDSNRSLDDDLKQAIQTRQDRLVSLVADVRKKYEALTSATPANKAAPATTQTIEEPAKASPAKGVDLVRVTVDQTPQEVAAARAQKAAKVKAAPQETVRVTATLIDDLVNLAGETSITRGRLEQQISDFSYTLDEMAATIERLREQLRRMDIETEAQVLFRTEREGGPDYADFDPLEMDRYSSIQQLSRALGESSSDLMDLRETLAEKSRDAETLLLQQSRINTELQEGLMKTRMIPFSSMVPRLRRIVRQISGELGKKVEFDVLNAEGEMDRTVLERMIAPLEHMLRNALDHGIETIEKRKSVGKSETGQITLSMSREGGDILLRMSDDGGGVNIEAVKAKAIKQGMLQEQSHISDHDALQFIMQPGFSTAQKVTQISGRGVGMDVVASEIKQLGGNITIDSIEGRGTTFSIRLPFTVSVNRALMVNTGEDFYAIPLNTIEGIVRVSAYELEEYYQPDAPLYEYAGQQYKLQYLGSVLHSEHQPKLQGQPLPLPVILVRGTDQPMALQVDSLMGSREIVVKSLGPQFSSVQGVSGATILGDGSVVVILDLPALIRADVSQDATLLQDQTEDAHSPLHDRPPMVMVVDDSVTVRKVTSRLLERNGMDVITAKDGVDAIAQLQDHKPDIMLLDIEMPRMDGFEVASLVRHDERLQDVPIVMITSRTGKKHRDRAMSIGVNEYLGKPFQEKELLSVIEKLTGWS